MPREPRHLNWSTAWDGSGWTGVQGKAVQLGARKHRVRLDEPRTYCGRRFDGGSPNEPNGAPLLPWTPNESYSPGVLCAVCCRVRDVQKEAKHA